MADSIAYLREDDTAELRAVVAEGGPALQRLKQQAEALAKERRQLERHTPPLERLAAEVTEGARQRDERVSPELEDAYSEEQRLRADVDETRRDLRKMRNLVANVRDDPRLDHLTLRNLVTRLEGFLDEVQQVLDRVDEQPSR